MPPGGLWRSAAACVTHAHVLSHKEPDAKKKKKKIAMFCPVVWGCTRCWQRSGTNRGSHARVFLLSGCQSEVLVSRKWAKRWRDANAFCLTAETKTTCNAGLVSVFDCLFFFCTSVGIWTSFVFSPIIWSLFYVTTLCDSVIRSSLLSDFIFPHLVFAALRAKLHYSHQVSRIYIYTTIPFGFF